MRDRLTCAIPVELMYEGNQLALLLGNSPEDGDTFREARWVDSSGVKYAVSSAVVSGVFFKWWNEGLPPERNGCTDRAAAVLARENILYAFGGRGRQQLLDLGLTPIALDPHTGEEVLGDK